MNKNLIMKCVRICLEECRFDTILLLFVSFALSMLPAIILILYNRMVSLLNQAGAGDIPITIGLMAGYCFLNFGQKSVYNFYNHYYLNYHTLLKFEKKMKKNFFEICYRLNLEDYLHPEIVNETRRAQNASINIFRVYQIAAEIVTAAIGILLVGGVVLSIHRFLIVFLLLAVIAPVADNTYQVIQKKGLMYRNTQDKKEEDEYFKLLTQPSYLKEIKVLNCFDFVLLKWLRARNLIMKSEKKSQTKMFIVSVVFCLIRLSGTVGAFYSLTTLFIGRQINLAEFSMAILTFTQITQLFNQLCVLLGNLSEFSVMVKPYFAFLEKTRKSAPNKNDKFSDDGRIELKNISYQYPNSDTWALHHIDFSIQQGDFVSIVGENGSGKTTLTKLLLGFLTPTEGGFVNSKGGVKSGCEEYLKEVSYIPQVFHCYQISIKDNLLFGRSIDPYLLDQSLKNIGLDDFINLKDACYGLEFGGMELSGGQKQRIAILRSLIKNGQLLIFDEPTSAIDPLQESVIYRSLLDAAKGKTTIMISHRLALTRQSNKIVVLKNGRVAESGNHESLMRKNGEYAKMWNAQSALYLTE